MSLETPVITKAIAFALQTLERNGFQDDGCYEEHLAGNRTDDVDVDTYEPFYFDEVAQVLYVPLMCNFSHGSKHGEEDYVTDCETAMMKVMLETFEVEQLSIRELRLLMLSKDGLIKLSETQVDEALAQLT